MHFRICFFHWHQERICVVVFMVDSRFLAILLLSFALIHCCDLFFDTLFNLFIKLFLYLFSWRHIPAHLFSIYSAVYGTIPQQEIILSLLSCFYWWILSWSWITLGTTLILVDCIEFWFGGCWKVMMTLFISLSRSVLLTTSRIHWWSWRRYLFACKTLRIGILCVNLSIRDRGWIPCNTKWVFSSIHFIGNIGRSSFII